MSARLQAIDTKLDGLHLVSIDQRAVESSKPVKPRKGVIVLVALIAGLVLGAFIALVRGAFKDHLRQMRVLEIEGSAQRVAVGEEGAVNGARLV